MESFPHKEQVKIREIFKQNHYSHSNLYSNKFRYSIVNDPDTTIIFGVKIPIELTISFHVPVELVSFYISIAIRPFWIDPPTLSLIDSFTAQFKNLVENTLLQSKAYKYEFHLNEKKEKILELVKKVFSSTESRNCKSNSSRRFFNKYKNSRTIPKKSSSAPSYGFETITRCN